MAHYTKTLRKTASILLPLPGCSISKRLAAVRWRWGRPLSGGPWPGPGRHSRPTPRGQSQPGSGTLHSTAQPRRETEQQVEKCKFNLRLPELEEKINVVLVLNLKWKNIYCCSLMSSTGWEKVLCSRFKPKVAELTTPLSCGRPIFTCVNYSRITIIRHQISHRMICGNSKVVHSM